MKNNDPWNIPPDELIALQQRRDVWLVKAMFFLWLAALPAIMAYEYFFGRRF